MFVEQAATHKGTYASHTCICEGSQTNMPCTRLSKWSSHMHPYSRPHTQNSKTKTTPPARTFIT